MPNPNTGQSSLSGVDASSANDVWAVGASFEAYFDTPMMLHWDGAAWMIAAHPNLGAFDAYVYDVEVLSPNDAWVVGGMASAPARALIEHWNGSSWSVVSAPHPANSYLTAIDAVSATDIWAVGGTLIEHWDGTSWSVVPGLDPPPNNLFRYSEVSAVSGNDVWVVGTVGQGAGPAEPLIQHWDGSSWERLSSARVGYSLDGLGGISSAGSAVWAAGSWSDSLGGPSRPLLEFWDGITWNSVSAPEIEAYGGNLGHVVSTGGNEFWAVGGSYEFGTSDGKPLIERCASDSDEDGLAVGREHVCGSNPSNGASLPERTDTPGDDDGDTLVNEALPPGAAAYDCDGDGYKGTAEANVATSDQDACGGSGWPSDIIPGGLQPNTLNIQDIGSFVVPVRRFGTSSGDTHFDIRWDLVPGSTVGDTINLQDIAATVVGVSGYPPMFGGLTRAYGKTCPYAP